MPLPTTERILAEIEKRKNEFFGWVAGDLVSYLEFNDAKPFLTPEATEADWKPRSRNEEDILAEMKKYMEFAWDKANNCRGLSANRSIEHMAAWMFMLGEYGIYDRLTDDPRDEYCYYGKPQLRAICEKYGWDWKKWDDDHWVNSEDDQGITADQAEKVIFS